MDSDLARLARLVNSDPGFYVLAVHAFVDRFLRDRLALPQDVPFADLIRSCCENDDQDHSHGSNSRWLHDLARQHVFALVPFTAFGDLAPEEAMAATHLLLRLLENTSVADDPSVHSLKLSLRRWDNREVVVVEGLLCRALERLHAVQPLLPDLLCNSGDGAPGRDSPVGPLDVVRPGSPYRQYLADLARVSLYTSVRMDYERTSLRLAVDQSDALNAIDRGGDFLIRGGPGTGKSLTLVEALKRTLEVGELDFPGQLERRAVLLTYTRTLVKFEDSVTSAVGIEGIDRLVQTVDAFLLAKLKRIDSSLTYDFDAVDHHVAECNTTGFFSDTELATEIETYLFGNVVTRTEYVDDVVDRVGLRRRLSRRQREQVWEIRDSVAQAMEATGRLSRNYARIKLLEFLSHESVERASVVRDVGTIFVDEAQDLTAGDLMTLRAVATSRLVMAADTDQTIYGVASPYARAGLSISGRTRLLHTNFRNTAQIQESAVRFRMIINDEKFAAFRQGPPPEVYSSDSTDRLMELMLAKVELFLKHVRYRPEDIAILAPHNGEVEHIASSLMKQNISTQVITTREFQFSSSGAVRLSTLHSSKGLDFPVVLIYLPFLPRREQFDQETTDRLARNLIFVGLARATESLNVFVRPGTDPVLADLVATMEGRDESNP